MQSEPKRAREDVLQPLLAALRAFLQAPSHACRPTPEIAMQMAPDTRPERLARSHIVHRENSTASQHAAGYLVPMCLAARQDLYARVFKFTVDTKVKGNRAGGFTADELMVIWALLFVFTNSRTGLCMPSYDALCRASGKSRQVVANAVRKANDFGFIKRVRRRKLIVVRFGDGMASSAWVQDSNLYLPQKRFRPDAVLIELVRRTGRPVRSNLPRSRPVQVHFAESISETVTHPKCNHAESNATQESAFAVDIPPADQLGRFSKGLGGESRRISEAKFGLIDVGEAV
jgi:hypothetical protein